MQALEILDNLRISSPCPASWEAMKGDDRVRFCDSCTKYVYNVSDLTAAESLRVIEENEGAACLRLYRRRDGTILTADCPVGLRSRLRRRMVRTWGAAILISVAVPSTILAYVKGSRPGSIPPILTGSGVTFSDWSDWALTVVGLQRRQSVLMGDIELCPVVPMTPVQGGQSSVTPAVPMQEGDEL